MDGCHGRTPRRGASRRGGDRDGELGAGMADGVAHQLAEHEEGIGHHRRRHAPFPERGLDLQATPPHLARVEAERPLPPPRRIPGDPSALLVPRDVARQVSKPLPFVQPPVAG